ncbi:hypothetical protein ADUPG1_004154, partial [Aduncisulcus paluster]
MREKVEMLKDHPNPAVHGIDFFFITGNLVAIDADFTLG